MAEKLAGANYAEWDAFVREAKGGTVFHTSWYLKPLAKDLEIYVRRDAAGKIESGMAITPSSFLGSRAARRPSMTAYNGPLVRPSAKGNEVDRLSDEKHRMVCLLQESPPLGMYDYLFAPEWTDMMPLLWNGFDISVGYTYQIPPAPPEEWRAKMKTSHRRDLRKAMEQQTELGITMETTERFDECYSLLCGIAELKEFNIATSKESLDRWWKAVLEHQAGRIYLLREKDGRTLCATLLVFDQRCSYYVVGGIRRDARKGPLGLLSRVLMNRVICDSHQMGLTFDFEGSVLPGVEPFVRGWGGRCLPKYRAVKIRTPWTYAAWALYRYWTGHRRKRWFASAT